MAELKLLLYKKWKHFESPDDNIVEDDDCRRPEHEVTAEDGLSKLENEDIIEVEWRRLDITGAVSPELVALYFVFIKIGNLKNLFWGLRVENDIDSFRK